MKYVLLLGFLFNNADILNKSSNITKKIETTILKRGLFEKTGYFFKKFSLVFASVALVLLEFNDQLLNTQKSYYCNFIIFFLFIYSLTLIFEYIRGKDFKGPND